MYELLGICVMLAALALLNACASLGMAVVWRLLALLVDSFSARTRADLLFMLRIAAPVLAAVIAHECGHLSARDNLKRTLLGICRATLLLVPFGRAVHRAWPRSGESAADEFAAEQTPPTALNLASALLTIAKMVAAGAR